MTAVLPCEVAILAGGMGTRLKARTGHLPKPMAPILGRPVLEYQIALCRSHGFRRIALLVHYESDVIRAHFGDGSAFGVEIQYSVETEPRGTAGALRDALPLLDERFLVLYGDTFADVDLRALWLRHAEARAAGTLLLHPNDHPHDSDLIQIDAEGRVVAVHPYPHPEQGVYRNLVNAALYVLERAQLETVIPATGRHDLAKHTFPAMLAAQQSLHAHVTPEYIKDMGTPERLDKVERDLTFGLPEKLSVRQARTAVFLDRDGTLNVEVNHLRDPAQLVLLPGAADAVRALNRAGVLAVGITNQPVVARGDVTWEGLERIHAAMDHQLGAHKAYLDRLYVCPHHPDKGFAREVPELKTDCNCRKPRTGLIDRAVRELAIDRRASWMVGDTTSDIEAGRRAGVRTVLVRTGHAGRDGKYAATPDYVMPDLAAAVDWVLHGHGAFARQLLAPCVLAALGRLVLIGGPARAGKTSAARVMAELLATTGRTVQVISLDGWLRPVPARVEGAGVLGRYDMGAAWHLLAPLLGSRERHWIQVPEHDGHSRTLLEGPLRSIGPDDLLIVEGVTALMENQWLPHASARVYVDLPDALRHQRLRAEYAWRGEPAADVEHRIASRELDELPAVRASAQNATHHIQNETTS